MLNFRFKPKEAVGCAGQELKGNKYLCSNELEILPSHSEEVTGMR